ncbi:hypothetical protein [Spirosoma validum]|uniref:Uncharacterized protein n=1 Tax=Spirosoma validum TaxID=2771355 RepID=A0A927B1M7_9BACT|nr:hypothetical protein [Spirosoma validum]MBD2753750.1 hypothetical protein [Spirosoma validum]
MKKRMAIGFIVLGGILLIAGMVIAIMDGMKPLYIILIAGVIALVGTAFGIIGKFFQDENSSKKSDKILEGVQDVKNYNTGGDSYCYLEFSEWPWDNKVQIKIKMDTSQKYPIHNLNVKLFATDQMFDNFPDRYMYIINGNKIDPGTNITVIGPGIETYLKELQLKPENNLILLVAVFEVGDGSKKWFQRTVFRRDKEEYKNAFVSGTHIELHRRDTQVYKITSSVQERVTDGMKKNERVVTQHILKEESDYTGTLSSLDWIKYQHFGINEQAYINKVLYEKIQ